MQKIQPHRKSFFGQDLSVMERWEKRDQDLYMKAGDNHMKINIMMDVNYQNKGLGSKVIGEVLSYLKSENYENIRLGVDKGNPQSYSFWDKNGFVTVGENQYIIMEQII